MSNACQECGADATVTSERGFFCERCDEIDEIRAERDEARADAEAFRRSMYALEERVCQIRAALKKYAMHRLWCGHGHSSACVANPCTCGLSEALKGAE